MCCFMRVVHAVATWRMQHVANHVAVPAAHALPPVESGTGTCAWRYSFLLVLHVLVPWFVVAVSGGGVGVIPSACITTWNMAGIPRAGQPHKTTHAQHTCPHMARTHACCCRFVVEPSAAARGPASNRYSSSGGSDAAGSMSAQVGAMGVFSVLPRCAVEVPHPFCAKAAWKSLGCWRLIAVCMHVAGPHHRR